MTHRCSEPGAFILAGGRSTRMGQDKALLAVRGHPLIERMVSTLRACGFDPAIAGSRADLAGYAPVREDVHPGSGRLGCGPLAGIEAGLTGSNAALNVCVAVDLPLAPPSLLRFLVTRAELTGAWATIPTVDGEPQPLCAAYRRELLPAIGAQLETGNYKVMHAMRRVEGGGRLDLFSLERVAAANGLHCGTGHATRQWRKAFLNCNTPEQWEEVVWELCRRENREHCEA